jgi:hypothetical protein
MLHRMNHSLPSSLTLSQHAACRAAQRAIPHSIVAALLEIGVRDYDHRGGIRVHVHHHRSKLRFIERVGREAAERFRNCYCVIDSEHGREVITVGWLNGRRTVDAPPPHRRRTGRRG